MANFIKIQTDSGVKYLNLDLVTFVYPDKVGISRVHFSDGEHLVLVSEHAKPLLDYLERLSIPVGIDDSLNDITEKVNRYLTESVRLPGEMIRGDSPSSLGMTDA